MASTTDATQRSGNSGERAPLILLLGGARSGKSALAVRWGRTHDGPVVFVATGWSGDDEMRRRIARHRAERPSGWQTVEQPRDVAGAVRDANPHALLIVDCLTLWVANMLDAPDAEILAHADALVTAAQGRSAASVVISNEVGWGIVPADPATRRYRDVLGEVNARVAQHATRSLLLVAGRAQPLESPPSRPTEVV